jgi:hypothetical protein
VSKSEVDTDSQLLLLAHMRVDRTYNPIPAQLIN